MMSIKISGTVIRGLGFGKKLGFPTINLDAALAPTALKHGVYAVRVNARQKTFAGAMHFGPRFAHGKKVSLEVHCLGLEEDVYGEPVEVEIVKKLRGVKNFESEDDLKKAIRADIAKAKKIL